MVGNLPGALAAEAHYNDASAVGGAKDWSTWTENWTKTATDYTKVSLAPGRDETQLNFAWYSKTESGKVATPVVHFGTDKTALQTFTGKAAAADSALTAGAGYDYNHVTVTGLKPSSTYYYAVERGGVLSPLEVYKTGDFSAAKILFVGDPQIGASKGQMQGGSKLVADSGVKNTAARNDSFGWNRTLNIALSQTPDLNFIISAGDQVNKTGKPKEEEYAGFLGADGLKSLPLAATIGNHDSLNPDYLYHFYNPNATEYGATQAGGDYYYSYGGGLFIVLNTNNYDVSQHEKAIREAVASDKTATWRVVTMHQDMFGTGADHSDTDGMILRTQLLPLLDKYDIDVVLQGHDHTYARTDTLYSDGKTHGGYEFQLNAEKTDYDWDNAFDISTGAKIPLMPQGYDGANAAFRADNGCYTVESAGSDSVTNPKGVLFLSANSASGSKYYELVEPAQDYVAARSQNWLPSYSVISMTDSAFTVDTYQITADGKTEALDKTFTIRKDAGLPAGTLLTRAQAAERFYAAAGTPAVTGTCSFSDVPATHESAVALAWAEQSGVVNGMDGGIFCPDAGITHEQLAAMLYRAALHSGKAVTADSARLSPYTDKGAVSGWAKDAMSYAVGAGLFPGATLAPKAIATAAELTAVLGK
ncbi:MAG: metallophosphoesterase [Oscillospiraceae bacterium]